ncbi:MAG: cell wall-binding repeat-containing protein, partial [Firmicutes bacterium]|nr:cell wall-binding repeat-containing protein [Bacillota bacterium]
ASGQKFADALVIGPVAGKLNAPVLLSKRDLLPAETKAQIKKADYKQITIVGLDGAISKAVEDELK